MSCGRLRARLRWSRFIYGINKLIIVRVVLWNFKFMMVSGSLLNSSPQSHSLPARLPPKIPKTERNGRKISVEFMSYTFSTEQQSLNIKLKLNSTFLFRLEVKWNCRLFLQLFPCFSLLKQRQLLLLPNNYFQLKLLRRRTVNINNW